ncbi:hemin ABC transporter ATP-binding protein [Ignatzschineria ureiclastica]|uniref:Hemin ABC transporter ATP-binding protein n=1 Tax=Ignatzschineria ureiclastica TaxID=472582 RepID=A0A2U2AH96_9GAMM|nr:ATP-binding cassette domain-containing protein [Ignatzschineria ureiclastica]PWD82010.1 hemin ABC transporter ATP-binding protein [Ignatzschineria ureiclastica]GGZ92012.1 hemin import ATP-binding protein HmuV [Ignatzschineria ureiclastica]
MFTLENVTLTYHQKTLLDIPQLSIQEGAFTALIGPNGAGKTTLLNLLAGDLSPTMGKVSFQGKPLAQYSVLELATRRSVLPQTEHIPFAIKAKAVILMGIMPFGVSPNHPKAEALLTQLAQQLELDSIINRPYQHLSGGEQHRVQIARVLLQTLFSLEDSLNLEERILLLDEPFNHLDLYHQKQLLRYFKSLTEAGLTIICVMHDINHALQIADQIILLQNGIIQGTHSPAELWHSKILSNLFKVDFVTLQHPEEADFSTLAFKV